MIRPVRHTVFPIGRWLKPFIPAALLFPLCGYGQTCKELGQNPGTAFPVCGVKTFSQSQVKLCGNRKVPSPCSDDDVTDKNPYWYKFTCYTAGTLGFLITPANLSDDYDWQLFDITGKRPEDVYSNKSLFVSCNWSGESGKTGASTAGTSPAVCAGFGQPLFSTMPTLVKDHQYLLLISHFTDSQSGYTLEFKDGTADITDPKVPAMESVSGSCKGMEIRVKLNKRLTCSSLAADGSDFSLVSGAANIVSASAPACSNGFDMDSVVLKLDRALSPGDYTIESREGSDGNTLLDNCGIQMPAGQMLFTVPVDVSAAFTYTVLEGCATDTVDFLHTAPGTGLTWFWLFDDNTVASVPQTTKIYSGGGDKNVRLIVSNAHCSDTIFATVPLSEKLHASFEAPEIICAKDKAAFTDHSTGNISTWQWTFGDGTNSNEQTPQPFNFPAPKGEKPYTVSLRIGDARGCTDSSSATVLVVGNCTIDVPTAFTPNNDGRNDELFPTNAFNADNLIFRIFNRYGQLVFETRDWRRKWDGNLNGQPQATGTYVWSLQYTLRATGKKYNLKGTTILIR